MAAAQVSNEKLKNPRANKRRRKKRRTEDFSSDSESSSSSSSSDEEQEKVTETITPNKQTNIQNKNVNIDGINIDSDDEDEIKLINGDEINQQTNQLLSIETQKKIGNIKFTSISDTNKSLDEVKETVKKERSQLEQEYLGLMAGSFSEDLDELRKKPDFTDKSLILLAKVLQSGSQIFDNDALDALVKAQ